MYSITITDTAKKQLKKLEKNIQVRIITILKGIRIRPEHYIKKVVGLPFHSLRIGKYRAILLLDLNSKEIKVIKIGHRKDIYKNLKI